MKIRTKTRRKRIFKSLSLSLHVIVVVLLFSLRLHIVFFFLLFVAQQSATGQVILKCIYVFIHVQYGMSKMYIISM